MATNRVAVDTAIQKAERRVLKAALKWWQGHRPTGFSLVDHLMNGTINATYTSNARVLAATVCDLEVALLAARRRKGRK